MTFDTDKLLGFWFADSILSPEAYQKRKEIWFRGPSKFDDEVKEYEPFIDIAAQDIDVNLNCREYLARIITLDQFPRNIYRYTSKAFAYDSKALSLARYLITTGMHEELEFAERIFAYLPLEHSEDMQMQELSVDMYRQLTESTQNQILRVCAQEALEFAQLHKDIIEQFDRFPHRNVVLGRKSTSAEQEYLESGAETFGQSK